MLCFLFCFSELETEQLQAYAEEFDTEIND